MWQRQEINWHFVAGFWFNSAGQLTLLFTFNFYFIYSPVWELNISQIIEKSPLVVTWKAAALLGLIEEKGDRWCVGGFSEERR